MTRTAFAVDLALRFVKRDAGEVSRMLAGRVQALVTELFPAGRRDGAEWRVGSLAGEAGCSLGIRLIGRKAGVWGDFAAGLSGDCLDLVAHAIYGGHKGKALDWSRRWLGIADNLVEAPERPPAPARGLITPDQDAGDAGRSAAAWRMFAAAAPAIAGTPAGLYLAGRGIELRDLGRQPRALRFHPALFNREAGLALPAMVAAVSGPDGKFCAVHRTWLEREDGRWRKAALRTPKMVLGRLGGGSIRLWRGASGKALAQALEGESLLIAEGIETGLSLAVACPERRVIAAVSVGNMAALVLPAIIRTVTIAADNDPGDSAAARALQAAIDRFGREGRRVLVARSPVGSDFNDALVAAP